MKRASCLIVGFLLVTCVARRTLASDTCTIMYRVNATFESIRVTRKAMSSTGR
ncbi:MAG: hypothetical protein JRE82_09180 [Deltaproteobacteria bacterium]|nr:hypothetical protein [Deltaproteobacteria bacterium]